MNLFCPKNQMENGAKTRSDCGDAKRRSGCSQSLLYSTWAPQNLPLASRHKSTAPDRCARTKSRGELQLIFTIFASRFQISTYLDSRPARCFLAPMTFTLRPGAVAPYNFASIFGSLEDRQTPNFGPKLYGKWVSVGALRLIFKALVVGRPRNMFFYI